MAGGAGGHEVERIAVKVVPDTGGFAEKLRAFLERIEAASEVEVAVTADTKTAEAQIKRLERDLSVQLQVVLNSASVQNVRRALARLTRDRTMQLHVDVDTAYVQARLRELGQRLQARVDVDLNLTRARAQLARLARDLVVRVTVDVDDFMARAKLAALTRPRSMTINVDYDRGIFQQLSGILNQIGQLAGSVGQQMSQMGQFAGSAFGTLSGSIGGATKALGLLKIAIIPVLIVAIGALIGAIVGLIVVIGGMAAALLSVVPAVGLVAAGIVFAFKGGTKEADQLKKQFESVGKTARSVLNAAIQPLMKELTRQLPHVNKWVMTLKGPLRQAFSASSQYVDELRIGLQNFTNNALKGLVDALKAPGMQFAVEGLMVLLGDLGKAFGDFFYTLAREGKAHQATLISLGNAIKLLLPSFANMLNAFSKASPEMIAQFAVALDQIFKMLSDQGTLNALSKVLTVSLAAIMATLSTIILQVEFTVGLWERLVAIVKWAFSTVRSIIQNEWNRIVGIFSRGAAAAERIAQSHKAKVVGAFNSLVSTAQSLWNRLVSFIGSVWSRITGRSRSGASSTRAAALGPFSSLVSSATALWNRLVGVVQSAWSRIQRIVSSISGAIGRVSGLISGLSARITSIPSLPFSLFSAPMPDLALPGAGTFSLMADTSFEPAPVTFKSASIMDSVRDLNAANRRLRGSYLDTFEPRTTESRDGQTVVERNTEITINAAPTVPTERTLLTALEYADALYAE